MIFKYVVFETYPVIFGIGMSHNQVRFKNLQPTSAGYVKFLIEDGKNVIDLICFGKSTSLGLNSRGYIDADLIKSYMGNTKDIEEIC